MPSSHRPYLNDRRILSVQSHVVSGYVGNRAATFPLQLLGYDVDVVNTVQFSNHTGYGHTNGHKTAPEQLEQVFSGLEVNGLGRWRRVLSGYIPGAAALQVVAREVVKLNERCAIHNRHEGADEKENVIYLMDPVMGDIGKGLYVAEDVVPIYREMLDQATIITPNQFEAELLSESKINNLDDMYDALVKLHKHVPCVAISSIPLPASLVAQLDLPGPPPAYASLLPQIVPPTEPNARPTPTDPLVLVCVASTVQNSELDTYAFSLPTIEGYFSGVGDLFSALVLGFYEPPEPAATSSAVSAAAQDLAPVDITQGSKLTIQALPPFARAVSKALLGVQNVLLRTHQLAPLDEEQVDTVAGSSLPSDDELDSLPPTPASKGSLPIPARTARRMRRRELRIVQEREALLIPLKEGVGWPGRRIDWTMVRK